ncbi:MAG: GumC family protein [Methylocystis sp.]|uniref:GumC family protein n=1 Tax=Methylocystis sp. TaxID=1911079 RepID=UPI003DA551A3
MRASVTDETEPATNDIDLSQLGRVLAVKRWWVLGATLAAFLGAALFVNVVKPRYTSDARLLLETQDDFLGRGDKADRLDANGPDAEGVQSQIQLLTSRDLARRAIKTLGLQGDAEFDPLAGGVGALTRALVLLGIVRDPTLMSPEDRILEKFSERLAVLSPTKTRVLSVEFSSKNPDLAARGANAVAETYIEMQQEAKREVARSAARSLATLVSDLRTRVAEAEAKVEAYRADSGLLIGANNTIIPTQQLGELNNQLSSARAAQADAQAKANLLRDMLRQGRVGEIPDVANNETIRRIFEQRVSLRAQIALESRTLLPQHPRIKELTAQLADIDQQWRAAAERTARTLENEARIAASRVDNLTRVLNDQKRVAGSAGAEEVKLRDLERAARLLKEQLEAETTKYQEALAREQMTATPADARIIQRALAPQLPAFPKKIPIIAFSTLAAFLLALGAIIAAELLTGRAKAVRAGQLQDDDPDEQDPFGEAIRTVRPATLRGGRRAGSGDSVSVLLAPCAGEGVVAATAARLARRLTRQGRALLVAANPGDPVFDSLVSDETAPLGLADLVSGEAGFEEALHLDVGSALHILPGGVADDPDDYEPELLIEALGQAYDFIVFAASAEEALRLGPFMDLAFVLGDDPDAEALRGRLERFGAEAHLLDGRIELAA